MNRLARILFHTLAGISVLLCIGSIVVWTSTYRSGRDWRLADRKNVTPALPAGAIEQAGSWTAYRWIGSSGGRIQFAERTMDDRQQFTNSASLLLQATFWVLNTPGVSPTGPRYTMPQGNFIRTSVVYYAIPPRVIGGNSVWTPPPQAPFVLLPRRGRSGVAVSRSVDASAQSPRGRGVAVQPLQNGALIISGRATTQPANTYSIGGVVQGPNTPSITSAVRTLVVSWWLIAFTTALLPAFWMMRFLLRRRAILRNVCINCGYDLRATPHRCPECGTVPVKQ